MSGQGEGACSGASMEEQSKRTLVLVQDFVWLAQRAPGWSPDILGSCATRALTCCGALDGDAMLH